MHRIQFIVLAIKRMYLLNPFQNGVEVKPSKDLRIYAMGRKRFLQIMKCHVNDSGIYTCDAGDTTTSCTVEVYGKVCCLNTTYYTQQPSASQWYGAGIVAV